MLTGTRNVPPSSACTDKTAHKAPGKVLESWRDGALGPGDSVVSPVPRERGLSQCLTLAKASCTSRPCPSISTTISKETESSQQNLLSRGGASQSISVVGCPQAEQQQADGCCCFATHDPGN
ncbi:hypothetical protein KIL84_009036 [Mauremys mutica]|uniref:Uncharacterized protein n=1 Tax=Mauremys mutica TaxID=74926 RepID=A0A9D3XJH8_9SAUR|nr:hypothetical protein KIL84_009036 [Mauremys mutica]